MKQQVGADWPAFSPETAFASSLVRLHSHAPIAHQTSVQVSSPVCTSALPRAWPAAARTFGACYLHQILCQRHCLLQEQALHTSASDVERRDAASHIADQLPEVASSANDDASAGHTTDVTAAGPAHRNQGSHPARPASARSSSRSRPTSSRVRPQVPRNIVVAAGDDAQIVTLTQVRHCSCKYLLVVRHCSNVIWADALELSVHGKSCSSAKYASLSLCITATSMCR